MKSLSVASSGIGVMALVCAAAPAFAAGGSSSAYDGFASLATSSGTPIDLAPINPAAGSGLVYDVDNTVGPYTLMTNLSAVGSPGDTLSVSTGALESMASGALFSTTGQATLNDVSASIMSGGSTLFSLSTTQVQSTSTAAANGLSGSTMLQNVMLGGSAVSGFNLTIPQDPSVDDVIYNSGGLEVILNAQTVSGDSITTDAVQAVFSSFPIGDGNISGSLAVAESQAAFPGASIAGNFGVPEPWAWVDMLAGVGFAGAVLRRRRVGAAA